MNATIKPTGLSYIGDEGTVSVYRLQAEGVHLMDVLVDNAVTIDPMVAAASGVKLQDASATLHPIAITTPDRKATLGTAGYGAKIAHIDGEGVSAPHIDGLTVAQYILPRAMVFMGKLLAARSEV